MNKREMQKILDATKAALELSNWSFNIYKGDVPPEIFGDEASLGTNGMCVPEAETRTAQIWLRPEATKEVLVHEILHVFYVENGHDEPEGESPWRTEAAINTLGPLILKAMEAK
jgi:hypothetical protein